MFLIRPRESARLLAAAVVTGLAAIASAHQVVYSGAMSGPAEAPPNASPGVGIATVTVDLDLATFRIQANFSGLTGTTTAAHIHGLTAVPGAGVAGVATQTPSFTGFPLGVTSGVMDTTYDMTLASSYNASCITANGGTVGGAFQALLTGLEQGRTYFNIHSTTFPGGEIRGFLIPEPASLSLLAGIPLIMLRRNRKT